MNRPSDNEGNVDKHETRRDVKPQAHQIVSLLFFLCFCPPMRHYRRSSAAILLAFALLFAVLGDVRAQDYDSDSVDAECEEEPGPACTP